MNFRIFVKLFSTSNSLIYFERVIQSCVDMILVDHCVIQTNIWAEAVCGTTVRNPATFKEELSAPRETLITAGWCNILLCLAGCARLVSGCLCKRRSNCIAQMGALNMAGPLSDGYTVHVQSLID